MLLCPLSCGLILGEVSAEYSSVLQEVFLTSIYFYILMLRSREIRYVLFLEWPAHSPDDGLGELELMIVEPY